jgi:hypothetical protein
MPSTVFFVIADKAGPVLASCCKVSAAPMITGLVIQLSTNSSDAADTAH